MSRNEGHLKYEVHAGRRLCLSEWEQAAKEYLRHNYGELVGYDEPYLVKDESHWDVPLHVTWRYFIKRKVYHVVFFDVGKLEVWISKGCKFEVRNATPRAELVRQMDFLLARVVKSKREQEKLRTEPKPTIEHKESKQE